jgi:alpha-ribazole phosphatase
LVDVIVSLYLVRHDKVSLKGVCYGQSNVALSVPAFKTAIKLKPFLPTEPTTVVSSHLSRCWELAKCCYTENVRKCPEISEIDFGDWEQKAWQDISRQALDEWAETPLDFQFPNGDSIASFRKRVLTQYKKDQDDDQTTVWFTHAGVIRLILAEFSGEPWLNLLSKPVDYGSVWRLRNGTFGQIN